jgi:hypothetical protein
MSKSQKFSLGSALVIVALAGVLKKENLAWAVFFIGLYMVAGTYPLDWVFGKERPSHAEINKMPADDYKKLLLNSRSRRWIDFVDAWYALKRKFSTKL